MKIINIKLFTFITTFLFSFSIMSVELPEIPKLPGFGGGSDDSPAVDLPSAQANLEATIREALANLNKAESHFQKALGNSEAAAAAESRADTLSSDGDVDLNSALESTASARKAGAEAESKAGELSVEAKQEYVKGLLPYAQGVALTVKVSDQAKSWIDAAQGEMKSLRNPMKLNSLRKSLAGGMKIAKAIPDFLKTLGTSSKGVFSFAKSQKMDTSNAEKEMPADEF
tara:strand:- start:3075 stop:3758 length:684 start_codon:yes stop_codon:yes gene_type:complete